MVSICSTRESSQPVRRRADDIGRFRWIGPRHLMKAMSFTGVPRGRPLDQRHAGMSKGARHGKGSGKRRAERATEVPRQESSPFSRVQVVWGTFIAAMTAVGGALWMLGGPSAPRLDGLALASVVQSSSPPRIDRIFDTRRPIEQGRWNAIVIHHSATAAGTPEQLRSSADRAGADAVSHCHFMVGNGNGMEDGGVFVDYRWLEQEPVMHAGGRDADWYNRHAVSICLVGDGENSGFTEAQIDRLTQLVSAICRRLNIAADQVVLHSDIASVRSPGRLFPGATFHERLSGSLGR
jgi:N-acetylmuramoyl-L-alanine amidase